MVVEGVDPDPRRRADGELGVLVSTHLTREATPVVRYWSNDYRGSPERCDCGRTHARAVGGIVGRHDDLVVFKGAKFYPRRSRRWFARVAEPPSEFRIESGAAGREGVVGLARSSPSTGLPEARGPRGIAPSAEGRARRGRRGPAGGPRHPGADDIQGERNRSGLVRYDIWLGADGRRTRVRTDGPRRSC